MSVARLSAEGMGVMARPSPFHAITVAVVAFSVQVHKALRLRCQSAIGGKRATKRLPTPSDVLRVLTGYLCFTVFDG